MLQTGSTFLTECPGEPVSIVLARANGVPAVPTRVLEIQRTAARMQPIRVFAAGGQARAECSSTSARITWASGTKVARIRVTGGNGLLRWMVEALRDGLESPMLYGKLAPGAVQRFPERGWPTRLAKRDLIRLEYVDGARESLVVQ